MGFSCGIVGLPNVGKSTLFNAITSTSLAHAANFPFCTIEPNSGMVAINDQRLVSLAKLEKSERIIPSQMKVVDIAGLVEGASCGEGLGNKFLGHIREVRVILHVLRCFKDDNIKHVNSMVDPMEDASLVEMELALADIQSLQRRLAKLKSSDKSRKAKLEDMIRAIEGSDYNLSDSFDPEELGELNLLSNKPVLYICNVEEENAAKGNSLSEKVKVMAIDKNRDAVIISAKIEEEISNIEEEEEKAFFLNDLGLENSGLDKIMIAGYDMLGLITFFTIGPNEARSWPIRKGALAPQAAGLIHSDLEKGFIKAEVISSEDYLAHGGISGCRQNGKLRIEGKEYQVKDGDVVHFKFNK